MEDLLHHFHSFLLDLPTDNKGLITGRKLSQVSIKNYLSDTRRFLNWTITNSPNQVTSSPTTSSSTNPTLPPTPLNNLNPHSLTSLLFSRYYQFLRDTNTPLTTINRHLSSLRRFGTFISIYYHTPNPTLNLPNLTPTPTPSSLRGDYLRHLNTLKLSSSTTKNYLSDSDQFLTWVNLQNLNLSLLTSSQLLTLVTQYKTHLESTDKSPQTVSRHLISLKKFLSFLASKKHIAPLSLPDSTPPVDLPTISPRPFYLLASATAILLLAFTAWQTLSHLRPSPDVSSASDSSLLGLLATPPKFPSVSFGQLLGASSTKANDGSFDSLTTSNLTVTSTGLISPQTTSIGSATIPTGHTSITIPNQNIHDTTQIYLTPTSETGNLVIYLKNKLPGISFTIATPKATTKPLTFNYWLIQTQ